MSGRSVTLDCRIDAVRRDLADIRLADRVFAPHYAVPVRRSAGRTTPILDAIDGTPLSHALAGEPFDVLEFTSTHGWGQSPIDGSVGFVARDALVEAFVPTHIVTSPATPIHADPSLARPLGATLAFGTLVAATPANDIWCEVDGGYVSGAALCPLADLGGDAVAHALRLKGVPATAGGRSGDGVDPAGLIFVAHALAGSPPPRFLDLQALTIGTALAAGDPSQRGDLIFFADHAAMLVDPDTVVHVDTVVRCDSVAALDRFGPVRARRRPA